MHGKLKEEYCCYILRPEGQDVLVVWIIVITGYTYTNIGITSKKVRMMKNVINPSISE